MCRYVNVQICKCADVQMVFALYIIKRKKLRRLIICTSAHLHICTSAACIASVAFAHLFYYCIIWAMRRFM